jgi:hypothetical protein
MEVATKTDFIELADSLNSKIDTLMSLITTKADTSSRVLNSMQIRERLNLSYQSFQNKLEGLVSAGMFKDGHWKMREADLEIYINQKISKNGN